MPLRSKPAHPYLEQILWFLLFLGWVPALGTYAFMLDPEVALTTGILETITDTMQLYVPYGFGLPDDACGWCHPALGIYIPASVLAVGLIVWAKRPDLWAIPAFLFWSSFIYRFNGPASAGAVETLFHLVYAGLSTYCAVLFLRFGHLISPAFFLFILLLLVDVLIATVARIVGADGPVSLLGPFFEGYAPNFVKVCLFAVIAVLVRMAWLIVRDNRQFVGAISWAEFGQILKQTAKLWFLAPVIFFSFWIFWHQLANRVVKPMIAEDLQQHTLLLQVEMADMIAANPSVDPGDLTTPTVVISSDPPVPVEPAMQTNMAARLELMYLQQREAVLTIRTAATQAHRLPAQARADMETAFPESQLPLMRVPKCWFFDPVCQTRAAVARGANDMMRDTRDGMIDGVVDMADAATAEGSAIVLTGTDGGLAQLAENHVISRNTATQSIAAGFRTWRNASLLATIYGVIILVKTLLIVFSRVLFSPKAARPVEAQFLPDDRLDGHPRLKRHGQTLRISKDDPNTYFVARWGVTMEGPPPTRHRPLGFAMPVARVFSGTWIMNRIDGNRGEDPYEYDAELRLDKPAEFVTWELREGERVVFRFSDFVGMSDTLDMGRVTSMSISTLILGRMIYYYAEGPGVLILRTTAAVRLSPSEDAKRPAAMPKLVAWGSSTRFSVLAALTKADTFLSGYNLRTAPEDAVIWDTSTQRGDGPGTGIFRFMKSFLLPI